MGKAQEKRERVLKAINHEEPDRAPITDFYWSLFLKKWWEEKGLESATDIYSYYDLDMIVVNPNMDPVPHLPEIVEDTHDTIVYRSGWGTIVKMKKDAPMPGYIEYGIKDVKEYATYTFSDPLDTVRYDGLRGDLVNMADSFNPQIPSLTDQVDAIKDNFCLFGGVCEPNEVLTRARGLKETMLDLAMYPQQVKAFAERAVDFMIEIGKEQLRRYECLSGMVVWGDIAYDNGMFYSPETWRKVFKPAVARLCEALKGEKEGLKLIYHGCGDARPIFRDLIEIGIDMYNPLEAKAGLDVVELKREYRGELGFYGNIDVRILADGTKEDVKDEVLRKLNGAKGGGYIVASDHSVPSNAKVENYEYMVELVREHGKYPLELGSYDLEMEVV